MLIYNIHHFKKRNKCENVLKTINKNYVFFVYQYACLMHIFFNDKISFTSSISTACFFLWTTSLHLFSFISEKLPHRLALKPFVIPKRINENTKKIHFYNHSLKVRSSNKSGFKNKIVFKITQKKFQFTSVFVTRYNYHMLCKSTFFINIVIASTNSSLRMDVHTWSWHHTHPSFIKQSLHFEPEHCWPSTTTSAVTKQVHYCLLFFYNYCI